MQIALLEFAPMFWRTAVRWKPGESGKWEMASVFTPRGWIFIERTTDGNDAWGPGVYQICDGYRGYWASGQGGHWYTQMSLVEAQCVLNELLKEAPDGV